MRDIDVWIVVEEFPYYDGGDMVDEVFATEELANAYVYSRNHPLKFRVDKWRVKNNV